MASQTFTSGFDDQRDGPRRATGHVGKRETGGASLKHQMCEAASRLVQQGIHFTRVALKGLGSQVIARFGNSAHSGDDRKSLAAKPLIAQRPKNGRASRGDSVLPSMGQNLVEFDSYSLTKAVSRDLCRADGPSIRNKDDEETCSWIDVDDNPVGLHGRNGRGHGDAKPVIVQQLCQREYADHKWPADAVRPTNGEALHAELNLDCCVPDQRETAKTSKTLPIGALTRWQGFAMLWSLGFHHLTTAFTDNIDINDASADRIWGPGRFLNSVLSKDQNDEKDCTLSGRSHDLVRLPGFRWQRGGHADGHLVLQLRQLSHANHEQPADAVRPTIGRALYCAVKYCKRSIFTAGRSIGNARLFAFAGLVGLAACAGNTATTTTPGTLGGADPSAAFVAQVFDTACLKTRLTYKDAPAVLTDLGFTQAGTGTYYNGRDNISVKLLGEPTNECSVVWGVRAEPAAHLAAYRDAMMAREPLDLSTSSFDLTGTIAGVTYFNTRSSAN